MIEYNRDHNNLIASAKYENLKQLIGNKGVTSMEYETTRIMSHLFSDPASVLTIKNQLPGCRIFGVKSGNTYKLIVFNDSGKSILLPAQMNCDGKLLNIEIKEAISSPQLTADTWASYKTRQESKPYSIIYLELK